MMSVRFGRAEAANTHCTIGGGWGQDYKGFRKRGVADGHGQAGTVREGPVKRRGDSARRQPTPARRDSAGSREAVAGAFGSALPETAIESD